MHLRVQGGLHLQKRLLLLQRPPAPGRTDRWPRRSLPSGQPRSRVATYVLFGPIALYQENGRLLQHRGSQFTRRRHAIPLAEYDGPHRAGDGGVRPARRHARWAGRAAVDALLGFLSHRAVWQALADAARCRPTFPTGGGNAGKPRPGPGVHAGRGA